MGRLLLGEIVQMLKASAQNAHVGREAEAGYTCSKTMQFL